MGVAGSFSAADIKRQGRYQKWLCAYCGEYCEDNYTIDHVVPLSQGGTNFPENIVLACASCNSEKGDRIIFPLLRDMKPCYAY